MIPPTEPDGSFYPPAQKAAGSTCGAPLYSIYLLSTFAEKR
jgi:hypothetical protein